MQKRCQKKHLRITKNTADDKINRDYCNLLLLITNFSVHIKDMKSSMDGSKQLLLVYY